MEETNNNINNGLEPPKKKNGARIIVIVLALIAIIILVLLICKISVTNNNTTENKENTENQTERSNNSIPDDKGNSTSTKEHVVELRQSSFEEEVIEDEDIYGALSSHIKRYIFSYGSTGGEDLLTNALHRIEYIKGISPSKEIWEDNSFTGSLCVEEEIFRKIYQETFGNNYDYESDVKKLGIKENCNYYTNLANKNYLCLNAISPFAGDINPLFVIQANTKNGSEYIREGYYKVIYGDDSIYYDFKIVYSLDGDKAYLKNIFRNKTTPEDIDKFELLRGDINILEYIRSDGFDNGAIYKSKKVKIDDMSEIEKVNGIIFSSVISMNIYDIVDDAVDAKEVRKKYKELFGGDVNFINDIDESGTRIGFLGTGSSYTYLGITCSYREKTDSFVCRPTAGGVSPDVFRMLTYIYNYEEKDNLMNVYVSVGNIYTKYDEKVGKNSSKVLSEYKNLSKSILELSYEDTIKYKIDSNNYKKFSAYKYTFKLNSDNKTYSFVSMDRIK